MRIGNHTRTAALASLMTTGTMLFGALPAQAANKAQKGTVDLPTTEQAVSPEEQMNQISTKETLSILKGLSPQSESDPSNWSCAENMGMRNNSVGGKYLQYHYFCEETGQPASQESVTPAMVYQHLQDIAKPYQDNLTCQNQQFTINGMLVQSGACKGPDPGGAAKVSASSLNTTASSAAKGKSTKIKKVNGFIKFLKTTSEVGLNIAKIAAK